MNKLETPVVYVISIMEPIDIRHPRAAVLKVLFGIVLLLISFE